MIENLPKGGKAVNLEELGDDEDDDEDEGEWFTATTVHDWLARTVTGPRLAPTCLPTHTITLVLLSLLLLPRFPRR